MMFRFSVAIAAIVVTACGGGAPVAYAPATTAPQLARVPPISRGPQIEVADLYHLRSVTDVQMSPDGSRATFTVINNDRIGAPWSQIWIADLTSGRATRWPGAEEGSNARWSRDSRRIAFIGQTGDGKSGMLVGNADGTGVA